MEVFCVDKHRWHPNEIILEAKSGAARNQIPDVAHSFHRDVHVRPALVLLVNSQVFLSGMRIDQHVARSVIVYNYFQQFGVARKDATGEGDGISVPGVGFEIGAH